MLVAVLSFLFLASLPSPSYVAYAMPTGQAIRAGRPIELASYTELSLPDRGAAYVREDTTLELRSRDALALQSGEAFFAVHAGYAVETPHATVTVEGTRFGVRVTDGATAVYVLEGRVRVADRFGGVRVLEAGESTDGDAGAQALWLADRVPPALMLDARVEPGLTEPRLEITVLNTGAAPTQIGAPADHGTLVAEVTGPDGRSFTLNLEMLHASFDPAADETGRVVVDASRPLRISCPLRRELFPGPGRYSIHVVYFSTPRHGWVGKLESAQPAIWEAP